MSARRPRRALLAGLLLSAVAIAPAGATRAAAAAAAAPLPPVKHVFVIVLENEDYATTFGPGSKAPYLATTLRGMGEHLSQYFGIGHESLDNYVAMVSGQAPNPQTQADCNFYTDFTPGAPGPNGQSVGDGCVYPTSVKTVADQLAAKGLGWKGYMEDMGNSATDPKTCRHPAINAQDHTQSARNGDQYAARHNPFVYFHSIIDTPSCAADDVPLDRLSTDLASAATTPALTFITPNLCHDGHDSPCVDGEPGGLVSADAFLQQWVPKILASPAYKDGGLLVVDFDEAGQSDSSACCGELPGPNSPLPGIHGLGGGRVGAVVLSRFVKAGSVNATPYNHYSLLRTIEDLFGLSPLGYAATTTGFGSDVYNAFVPPAAAAPAGPAPPAPAAPAAATGTGAGENARGALPSTGGTSLLLVGLALLLLGAAAKRVTAWG